MPIQPSYRTLVLVPLNETYRARSAWAVARGVIGP